MVEGIVVILSVPDANYSGTTTGNKQWLQEQIVVQFNLGDRSYTIVMASWCKIRKRKYNRETGTVNWQTILKHQTAVAGQDFLNVDINQEMFGNFTSYNTKAGVHFKDYRLTF